MDKSEPFSHVWISLMLDKQCTSHFNVCKLHRRVPIIDVRMIESISTGGFSIGTGIAVWVS
jgi:hypothetical protein